MAPELRRPLVLDAALTVWLERGYASTTINAIADQAGVTKPVVYQCFANKDDVLRSLLSREETRLLAAIESSLPNELDFDDLPALLSGAYAAFFSATSASPDSWRVVFDAQNGVPHAVAKRIHQSRSNVIGQIEHMVHPYLIARRSDNPKRESAVIAELLVSAAESGARLLLNDPPSSPRWDPQDLADFISTALLKNWV